MTGPDASDASEPPEPYHGFVDSRRLPGPNRYFADPAVTLTARGSAAQEPKALESWAERVRSGCAALAWPDPMPIIERHEGGTLLVFRAPHDAQLTATELNEWAWERSAVSSGESHFDLAQDLGEDALTVLADRAAAERHAALAHLRAAAAEHSLPLFEDDVEISIGAGSGSRRWPRDRLPGVNAVPWSELHDVPTALVTGSNGKTTTVRLLAAMAAAAGFTPGYCCTEGVFIGGRTESLGDYSGPEGARSVLRNRGVTFAVLETARGGILRRGLAVQRAAVAVVTNVRPDHFGEYGVENSTDLAETKLVVARAVRNGGVLVLNADDATLMEAANRLPYAAAARRALFASEYDHPALVELRARRGVTCAVRDACLVLDQGGDEWILGEVAAMPLTCDGAARYNVANLAAAILAGVAMELPRGAMADTLKSFGAKPSDNPGRLERWRHRGALVLIDYAHNPDALEQLLRTARGLAPERLLLMLGQAGNRDDAAIAELARTAARFDPARVVIKELPLMLRGRMAGEVSDLIERALLAAGMASTRLVREPDEEAAARNLLDGAQPGDVIVLPVHTRAVRDRLRAMLEG